MFFRNHRGFALAAGLLVLTRSSLASSPAAPSREAIDFFESKVRPVLVDQCYSCHSHGSSKGVKGGLYLDTKAGWEKGGDTGPAIVPGDPDKSLLIRAVRYADEQLQMPPKGKRLSPDQVHALEQWVRMGAPDPRNGQAAAAPAASASSHWAFQPVHAVVPPPVRNDRWVKTPVDAFILAALEREGMSPSPKADRRTLIRRVSYDITGLPPSDEEVRAFVNDPDPNAYAALVDRLLNSHHYGERWGRFWLDIARYADTKGYVFEEERRYPYAYTYRDYVIRAFNDDLPFDRFIIEQLAADKLPLGEDKRPLAALGFLTLGRRFLNNQHDIIDDRIDLVGRGLMGLTLACARCHDHKYDPIPAKDYYSLYGVFASSHEPGEKPLLGNAAPNPEYQAYLDEHKRRVKERDDHRENTDASLRRKLRERVGTYLLTAHEARALEDRGKREALARERSLDPGLVQKYADLLPGWKDHPVLGIWSKVSDIGSNTFQAELRQRLASLRSGTGGATPANPLVLAALETNPPTSLSEVAKRLDAFFGSHAETSTASPGSTPADKAGAEVRAVLFGSASPVELTTDELRRMYEVKDAQRLRALQRKVEELDAIHPGAPPRAMALLDNATPHEPRVFVRGNPGNHGPQVPRQFLEVLTGPNRQPFTNGSGRLELARAIASRDNPLTARVMVNRIWLNHIGAPLVRTPADFGVRSDPPTHPGLLDYLAFRFMDGGWSVKKLHRLILLSNTYQQSSDGPERYAARDSSNSLLWRMNRRRLDLESMRDTLLEVAGRLDSRSGGLSVDITTAPFARQRTVYGFIERQNLPAFFRTFDFASPDVSNPQRFQTTVPQQALFFMNHPFVVEQARALASEALRRHPENERDRIQWLHRAAFQRGASPYEVRLGQRFVERQASFAPPIPDRSPWQYGHGRYDTTIGRVAGFTPLPHFNGEAWQGGPALPDEKLSWTRVTAAGGHPGHLPDQLSIRRWIAPAAGWITVEAKLGHDGAAGDGVRGRIVSDRLGPLGEWIAEKSSVATPLARTPVQPGDAIDFVVDGRTGVEADTYTWSPLVRFSPKTEDGPDTKPREFRAKADFGGPGVVPPKPLDAWEQYAQVLLLSNETMFVD